jgi:hypothetical protein
VSTARSKERHLIANVFWLSLISVPDSAVDLMPYYTQLDSAGRAQADSMFKPTQQFVTDSHVLFSQGGRNQVVRLSRLRHYVFLDRPTEVAHAIRGFLRSAR